MSRTTIAAAALLALAAGLGQGAEPEVAAKAAALRFLQSFQERDLDAILGAVALPWFHDGKTVIEDRAELEREFRNLLERRRHAPKRPATAKAVFAYRAVRDKLKEEERRLIDRVLTGETDQLVLAQIERAGQEKPETVVLLVRLGGGKAQVAGIKN